MVAHGPGTTESVLVLTQELDDLVSVAGRDHNYVAVVVTPETTDYEPPWPMTRRIEMVGGIVYLRDF